MSASKVKSAAPIDNSAVVGLEAVAHEAVVTADTAKNKGKRVKGKVEAPAKAKPAKEGKPAAKTKPAVAEATKKPRKVNPKNAGSDTIDDEVKLLLSAKSEKPSDANAPAVKSVSDDGHLPVVAAPGVDNSFVTVTVSDQVESAARVDDQDSGLPFSTAPVVGKADLAILGDDMYHLSDAHGIVGTLDADANAHFEALLSGATLPAQGAVEMGSNLRFTSETPVTPVVALEESEGDSGIVETAETGADPTALEAVAEQSAPAEGSADAKKAAKNRGAKSRVAVPQIRKGAILWGQVTRFQNAKDENTGERTGPRNAVFVQFNGDSKQQGVLRREEVFLEDGLSLQEIIDRMNAGDYIGAEVVDVRFNKKASRIEMRLSQRGNAFKPRHQTIPSHEQEEAVANAPDAEIEPIQPADLQAEATDAPAAEAIAAEVTDAPVAEAIAAEVTEAPAAEAIAAEVTEAPAAEAIVLEATNTPVTEAHEAEVTNESDAEDTEAAVPDSEKGQIVRGIVTGKLKKEIDGKRNGDVIGVFVRVPGPSREVGLMFTREALGRSASDKQARVEQLNPGDSVWVKVLDKRPGEGGKLHMPLSERAAEFEENYENLSNCIGTEFAGTVVNVVTKIGAFIDIGCGREALLRVNSVKGGTNREKNDRLGQLTKGATISVFLTKVGKDQKEDYKLLLEVAEEPPLEATPNEKLERYRELLGTTTTRKGTITWIDADGVNVRFFDGVEGYLATTEFGSTKPTVKKGQTIGGRVIGIKNGVVQLSRREIDGKKAKAQSMAKRAARSEADADRRNNMRGKS